MENVTIKKMTTAESKEALKSCLLDYLEANFKKAPNGNYICPFCNSGTKSNATSAFSVKGNYWKCFSCQAQGDLFDLIGKKENLETFDEQFNRALELYPNITSGDKLPVKQVKASPADESKLKKRQEEVQNDLIKFNQDVNKTDYLTARGFSKRTINLFMLGYDTKKDRVTIPYNAKGTYYTARLLNDSQRYYKPSTELLGKEPLFNAEAIANEKPLFVTEGALDAISLYEALESVSSVALCGCGIYKLIEELTARGFKNTVILSLDNDKAGKEATEKLKEALKGKNINYIEAIYSMDAYNTETKKDVNELLIANKEQLKADIEANIELANLTLANASRKQAGSVYGLNLKEYLKNGLFSHDLSYFKKYKNRKTGFSNLDENFTMYSGLAVLGGVASLGKSTFAINWADNMARAGEKVLYFALEQQPSELVTKLITREAYLKGYTAITNTVVKNGGNEQVDEAISELTASYELTASNIDIVKCDFSITAEDIKQYIADYIEQTSIKPIVFIDYLQLISTPESFKGDTRACIDHVVKVLKTVQMENDLFMMVISNFNREAYKDTVSFTSFKESGMVEYTADYVFGLQLAVMEGDEIKNAKTASDRNKLIFDANNKYPKEVELVSLKNRNGKQSFKCFFKYFMAHDSFIPDFNSQYDYSKAKTANKNNTL